MPKVKRIVLGLTGGVGTGKSTVVNMLRGAGIPCLSSDDVAHQAIRRGEPAYRQIARHFGPSVVGADREIDRSALGRIVFANARERRWLERAIHPQVLREVKRFTRRHQGILVLDIPLLFEAHWQPYVDKIVVVACPKRVQIERLQKRNRWSRRQIHQRLLAQWPLKKKEAKADLILDNSGTKAHLRRQVNRMLTQLNLPSCNTFETTL